MTNLCSHLGFFWDSEKNVIKIIQNKSIKKCLVWDYLCQAIFWIEKKIGSLDKLHNEISKKIRAFEKNTDNNGSINEQH